MPVLPTDRNQTVDLLRKSIDWFLYEGTLAFNGLSQCSIFIPPAEVFGRFQAVQKQNICLKRVSITWNTFIYCLYKTFASYIHLILSPPTCSYCPKI